MLNANIIIYNTYLTECIRIDNDIAMIKLIKSRRNNQASSYYTEIVKGEHFKIRYSVYHAPQKIITNEIEMITPYTY